MVDKGKCARLEEVNQGEIARLEDGRSADQRKIARLEKIRSRRD